MNFAGEMAYPFPHILQGEATAHEGRKPQKDEREVQREEREDRKASGGAFFNIEPAQAEDAEKLPRSNIGRSIRKRDAKIDNQQHYNRRKELQIEPVSM